MRILSVILLLLPLLAQADSCDCVIASGKFNSGKDTLSVGEVKSPCPDDLSALNDDAQLCVLNGGSTTCFAWASKPQNSLCPSHSGDSNEMSSSMKKAFFDTLLSMWTPQASYEYGGKNLKASNYLEGLPYGDILLPHKTLVISLASVDLAGSTFNVQHTATKQPVAFTVKGNAIVIDSGQLNAEQDYHWMLQTRSERYQGDFSTAYPEDQQAFESELSKLEKQLHLTGSAKDIVAANLAKDYGYTFDYMQYLRAAKSKLRVNHQGD